MKETQKQVITRLTLKNAELVEQLRQQNNLMTQTQQEANRLIETYNKLAGKMIAMHCILTT